MLVAVVMLGQGENSGLAAANDSYYDLLHRGRDLPRPVLHQFVVFNGRSVDSLKFKREVPLRVQVFGRVEVEVEAELKLKLKLQ